MLTLSLTLRLAGPDAEIIGDPIIPPSLDVYDSETGGQEFDSETGGAIVDNS